MITQWEYWIKLGDWARARRAMPADLADKLGPLLDAADKLARLEEVAPVPIVVRVREVGRC